MHNSCADPENSVRMEVPENFVLVTDVYKRDVRTSLEKQLDPSGPIASREGSVSSISKEIYSCVCLCFVMHYFVPILVLQSS